MSLIVRALVALATHLDRLPLRRSKPTAGDRLLTGTLLVGGFPDVAMIPADGWADSDDLQAGRILPGRIDSTHVAAASIKAGALSTGTIGGPQ